MNCALLLLEAKYYTMKIEFPCGLILRSRYLLLRVTFVLYLTSLI